MGRDSDLPIASGVCRVRGSIWVILSTAESLEERSDVLVEALTAHAVSMLEDRYLPPAVRARLRLRERPSSPRIPPKENPSG